MIVFFGGGASSVRPWGHGKTIRGEVGAVRLYIGVGQGLLGFGGHVWGHRRIWFAVLGGRVCVGASGVQASKSSAFVGQSWVVTTVGSVVRGGMRLFFEGATFTSVRGVARPSRMKGLGWASARPQDEALLGY